MTDKIGIDELIKDIETNGCKNGAEIIDSLRRLKAIDDMRGELLVPDFVRLRRVASVVHESELFKYIDTLRDLLAAERVKSKTSGYTCIGVIDSNGDIYPESPGAGTQIFIIGDDKELERELAQ